MTGWTLQFATHSTCLGFPTECGNDDYYRRTIVEFVFRTGTEGNCNRRLPKLPIKGALKKESIYDKQKTSRCNCVLFFGNQISLGSNMYKHVQKYVFFVPNPSYYFR